MTQDVIDIKKKIRIIIIDNSTSFQRQMSVFLHTYYPNFEVVGCANNGRLGIDLLKTLPCDIVLLDLEMDEMDGWQALNIIRNRFGETKVVISTFHREMDLVANVMEKGANAYLSKDCGHEEIERALLAVYNDGVYIEDSISKQIAIRASSAKKNVNLADLFTKRERIIYNELIKLQKEKVIAEKLGISQRGVHFHRVNIYAKTGSHCIEDLINFHKGWETNIN